MVMIYTEHAMMQMTHPVMLLIRLKLIVYFGYRLANIKLVWGIWFAAGGFLSFFCDLTTHPPLQGERRRYFKHVQAFYLPNHHWLYIPQ